ncbi:MAG: GAF and ANTAR domain-containing protein [Specibacter sp.]
MSDDFSSSLQSFGGELCSAFMQELPVSGVSITVFPGHAPETSIFASDATAAKIDELQFDLGEGPRWEALRTHRPVLLPYVKLDNHAAWPVFAKELMDLDVASLFVFPLALGAMDIGCIELYSTSPGPLSKADQSTALQLTNAAAWKLLRHILAAGPENSTGPAQDSSTFSRREVHQATGMVLAQTGMSATDSLLLLRAHAFSQGRTVRDVARDVVSRELDFTPPRSGY